MKVTMYELLGMVKNDNVDYKYVKYFDRLNEKDDVMLACAENIIYKLDNSNIELNDTAEIIEEPKGIPEKLDIEQDTPNSNYYIKNEFGTKCALTKHSKIIADKVNEICDYLESKGE